MIAFVGARDAVQVQVRFKRPLKAPGIVRPSDSRRRRVALEDARRDGRRVIATQLGGAKNYDATGL